MIERWKTISGFPDYEVSDLGNVRSYRSGTLKPITLHQDKRWGYWHFGPRDIFGKRKNLLIHRVVAEAFFGPCPPGMQVNHKNGVKSHNQVSNLEYVTPSGNHRHARKIGLMRTIRGDECSYAKLTVAQVREIREARKAGMKLTELAEKYGVSFQHISSLARGVTRSWLI